MKRILTTMFVLTFLVSGSAFADLFDNLSSLSPTQKEQLTEVYSNYKKLNNELETQILSYNAKMAQVQQETDKTASDIQILLSAYKRNIDSLKAEQEKLDKNLEESYKSIMTQEQFSQYLLQKDFAQSAFTKFLQK